MKLDIRFDCSEIDWTLVSETLKSVGMAYYDPDDHRRAFEASHTAVFIFHDDRMVGFGRAISDGVYQAAIYDVAVVPKFQGEGIGAIIVKEILARVSGCTVLLYAAPGKEDFYKKFGLRKMKTGMALFTNPERMAERGFTE